MTRDEKAQRLAAAAERIHERWKREHPDATTLEELATIFRIGNSVLRHSRMVRR